MTFNLFSLDIDMDNTIHREVFHGAEVMDKSVLNSAQKKIDHLAILNLILVNIVSSICLLT